MKKIIFVLIVLSFVFVAACAGPQRLKVSLCEEKAGAKDCRTFEVDGTINILPLP